MRTLLLTLAAGASLAAAAPAAAAPAAAAEPLVDADWLSGNLDRENLVVLDIRYGEDFTRAEFEAGHVPGAVYSNYAQDPWRTERDGVPGMLPPVEELADHIGGLGIGEDSHVVIVPHGDSASDYGSATRVYWTLKILGHDEVSILNGGHDGWAEAGGELESGWNAPEAATFEADFRDELLAETADVQAAIDGDGVVLVDARPVEQYRGEAKAGPVARAGTLPGAVNIPQNEYFADDTGDFASAEHLAALWEAAGVDGDTPQIAFCNTGHWASLGWFAASEVLGHADVAMYDGSMAEWARDESREMVNVQAR